jgi:hypothetical protein
MSGTIRLTNTTFEIIKRYLIETQICFLYLRYHLLLEIKGNRMLPLLYQEEIHTIREAGPVYTQNFRIAPIKTLREVSHWGEHIPPPNPLLPHPPSNDPSPT